MRPAPTRHRIEHQAVCPGFGASAIGLERRRPELQDVLDTTPTYTLDRTLDRSANSTASASRPPHRASIRKVASLRRQATSTAHRYWSSSAAPSFPVAS